MAARIPGAGFLLEGRTTDGRLHRGTLRVVGEPVPADRGRSGAARDVAIDRSGQSAEP
jgi:hypothetical protein